MLTPELLQVRWSRGEAAIATWPRSARTLVSRLQPLLALSQWAVPWLQHQGHAHGCLRLQLHDEDPQVPCLRFDAPAVDPGGPPLIPDPYALASQGFAGVQASWAQKPLPPWPERLPQAIWRGSTTGQRRLSLANLDQNLRVQLCRLSQAYPTLLDARLTQVVQVEATEHEAVYNQLLASDLLAPRLSPWHLALHRWQIDLDGNVNSWGLLWKLLSGSCLLRVSSPRRQWYHDRLRPWVHVVPVAADLRDLAPTLQWCRNNPNTCQQIAQAGQRLALEVVAALQQDQRHALQLWAQTWMHQACGNQPAG